MNYCPECGCEMIFDRLAPDIPADHRYYFCVRSGHRWEETSDKSGELLHIAPVNKEQEGGEPHD